MHRRTCASWILIASLPVLAGAADHIEVGPPPTWVLPAPTSTPDTAASEAPIQLLSSDQQLRITREGIESYIATRLRIHSPEGLNALGTIRLGWKPDTDVLTLHTLTVTRDGQVRVLASDPSSFTVLRREDLLEQAILTGVLTAVLQPPDLRVGDVLEMTYTLSRKDPLVADKPDAAFMWANQPVPVARFRALWPESLPMRVQASAHMPTPRRQARDGWTEIEYPMGGLEPLLQPNGAPLRYLAMRRLELTSFDDWAQVSRRLAPLYEKASALKPDSPLHAEVARIRAQHADRPGQAAAALQLVQDQVRYVLLAMNDGGLVPASADETWQRRFGDCKAKTAMLLALLHGLGIQAEPVAVSTTLGDGLDERLPGIGLFDHVLVRATVDGKAYWLDGTRIGDRSLALLQPVHFRWALPLAAAGATLVPIPIEPLREPTVVKEMEIDAASGIEEPVPFTARMTVVGDAARALKQNFDGLPPLNREEAMRGLWREEYHNLELDKVESRFDDATARLTWTATGKVRLEFDEQYRTYQPSNMSLGYRADFSRPPGTDAKAPFAVDYPAYSRSVETIRLPARGALFTLVGTDIDRTIGGGHYRRKASINEGVFTAETTYRSIAPEFPASQAPELQRVLLEMSRNTLYLKKPALGVLPAAPVTGVAERMRLAGEAMQRGDFASARRELEAVLTEKPDEVMARRMLAGIALVEGRPDDAVRLMEPVLAENDPRDRMLTGRAQLMQGKPAEALRDAESAIAADPRLVPAHELKAESLQAMGRRAEIPAVAQALAKVYEGAEPGSLAAARILLRDDRREEARLILDASLAMHASAAAHILRAASQREAVAAAADIGRAFELDKELPTLVSATSLLLTRGWYPQALDAASQAAKEQPGNAALANLHGIALWKTGDVEAAQKAFGEARDGTRVGGSLNNLCWTKATYGVALEQALAECESAIAATPECAACLDSRAFVLLRLGRLPEAVESYDAALKARPTQPESLFGRGVARLRLGEREAGEKDLVAARSFSPYIDQQFEEYGVRP